MSATREVTVLAPINIAFIKYWGKREGGESLILPTNDSFSITLSTGMFRSKTSVILSEAATEDTLWLNGEKVNVAESKRLQNVLATVRATCPANLAALKVTIVSNNNFPTAAGMASSASGYCALACALVKIFESTADASMLARVGSGSACRSVYGGFVKWLQGTHADGTDCIAQQFRPAAHWPEMNVLCAVVKAEVKDVPSTAGMQLSLKTSPLMAERIAKNVPERMEAVSKAIEARDFDSFAAITMVDSDDLQAVCATTIPKIQYATQQSYSVIKLVHAINAAAGKKIVAYTFDAGANAFLFTLDENLVLVAAVLLAHFPSEDSALAFEKKGLVEAVKAQMADLPENMRSLLPAEAERGPLTYLLQSPVGSGPSYLAGDEESLIDATTLQPKKEWKP